MEISIPVVIIVGILAIAICAVIPPHELRGRVVKRRITHHEGISRYRGIQVVPHLTVDILPEYDDRSHTYWCNGVWYDRLHEGTVYTLLVKGRQIVGIKHDKPKHSFRKNNKRRKKN